jgi:hypothetical protein
VSGAHRAADGKIALANVFPKRTERAVKVKTALRQSILGIRFSIGLLVVAGALAYKIPNAITCAFVVFVAFHVVSDLINIIYIKRKAARDSSSLEENIK